MRIMDLDSWPPKVGWQLNSKGGDFLSLATRDVIIERVVRVLATYIIFTCTYQGRSVYYELQVQEPKRTERVAEILLANIGTKLSSVETMEIDDRVDQKIAS
jgi:hypothetical protein